MKQKETLYFSNNPSVDTIIDFTDRLYSLSNIDEVIIDFKNMGRVEPFGLVYLALAIREFWLNNPDTLVNYRNYHSKPYPANMGFFQAIYLNHGKKPGELNGNQNYLPISIRPIEYISQVAARTWEEEQQVIERLSSKLAQILSRNNKQLHEVLTYSFREIIRNIYEHSYSKNFIYSAQYWPSYNKVEVAIVDCGRGIRESLSENPFMNISTDLEGIQQALMPGISGKMYEGKTIDHYDVWQNSGYGLYMLNRLCRNGGEFFIKSGSHGVYLKNNEKRHIKLNHQLHGTAIKMVIDVKSITTLNEMTRIFAEEGRVIAKQLKGVGYYNPSAASLMLSSDFKK